MRMRLCLLALLLATPVCAQDMPLSQILKEGETWRRVEGKFEPIGGLLWDRKNQRLELFDPAGKPLALLGEDLKSIPGKPEGNFGQHLVNVRDKIDYKVENGKLFKKGFEVKLPLKEISDIIDWEDGGTVVVADPSDRYLWAFRVEKDGSLGPGDRYYRLFVRRGETRSEAKEMMTDNLHRLYVGSKEGIQVFDPTGRLCGVLTKASDEPITALNFGGEKGDLLFVAHGKELYVRKMTAQAHYIPLPAPKKK